jgi:hypothetical protein
MTKTLYIIIGCDTDPDRQGFIREPIEEARSWRGMTEGIPRAKEALAECKDVEGRNPTFTWCLRADHQIKSVLGSYSSILDRHHDLFVQLEKSGDELAWHPHFWRHDEELSLWYQEVEDMEWQVSMLREAHAAYATAFPGRPTSVRMGWDYHNNHTVSALDSLGIKVDFSGIPGLRIAPKGHDNRKANFFDWRVTPNHPYTPSQVDYRRACRSGESSYKLLEAPNFVSDSLFWGLFGGAVLAKKMKDPRQIIQSITRPTYWIGITAKPFFFAPVLAQAKRTLRRHDKLYFVSYFHPDELLDKSSALYSLDNMKSNIRELLKLSDDSDTKVLFLRASDIRSIAS